MTTNLTDECMQEFDDIVTFDGQKALTNEIIQKWRDEDRQNPNPYRIIAQKGGQENILCSDADISIVGGSRGGSKSFSLLMETLRNITDNNFRSIILRSEIDALTDLVDTSFMLYKDFGTYNRTKNDMTWNFNSGGWLKFSYHGDALESFKTRFQGKQFAYIAVDEITQIAYEKFKYLITDNRNAFGFRNRFLGSCNPDSESWVYDFIKWWLDPETGIPIPERDGVVRYCFMKGDDVKSIIWGSTRHEVYMKCKEDIDKRWSKEMARYGKPEDLFIKSATFISAKLLQNIKLLDSDPAYYANLIGQSDEQVSRDLDGCWRPKISGNDMIKQSDLEHFFDNPSQFGDKVRRMSVDAAFDGGDNLVAILWIGYHIQDIYVCRKDSKGAITAVKAKMEEWGVLEHNMTYDLNGIGQSFKGFFPKATPFNNREAVDDKFKGVYANLKSQAAYYFYDKLTNGELSINPSLLTRKYDIKGSKGLELRHILSKERRVIRASDDKADHGFTLIRKPDMKRLIGHSPDFVEAMVMRFIFDIKKTKRRIKGIGLWC